MIYVTTGTHYLPFDRLLTMVKEMKIQEDLVVQAGTSKIKIPGAQRTDYVTYQQTIDYISQARLVITAAGPATIFQVLQYNRNIPLVVPRLKRFGEHVSDHQLYFAEYLAKKKLITLITNRLEYSDLTTKPAIKTQLFEHQQSLMSKLDDYFNQS